MFREKSKQYQQQPPHNSVDRYIFVRIVPMFVSYILLDLCVIYENPHTGRH